MRVVFGENSRGASFRTSNDDTICHVNDLL
jgi:hypothetical protein